MESKSRMKDSNSEGLARAATFEEVLRPHIHAVNFLAEQSLSQMENLLKQNPSRALGLDKAIPAEIDEARSYFAIKIESIRKALRSLLNEFGACNDVPGTKSLLRLELLRLFIIFESSRSNRFHETQQGKNQPTWSSVDPCIDDLVLNVINMRERLK